LDGAPNPVAAEREGEMPAERVVDYDILGHPITARRAGWPAEYWFISDEEAELDRQRDEATMKWVAKHFGTTNRAATGAD